MRWPLLLLPLLLACPQSGPAGPQQGERRTTRILVSAPTQEVEPEQDDREVFPIAGVPSTAPDGPWEKTVDGQVVVRGEFQGGRPVGAWRSWYASGAKRVEGALRDGLPDGEWRIWYEDGTPREVGGYVEGKPAGVWQLFYENGKPFERMSHFGGEPDGLWTLYWPNGTPADVMTWVAGVQTGLENSHSPDGVLVATGEFQHGRPTGTWTCHGPEGPRTIEAPKKPTTPRVACGGDTGPFLPPPAGAEAGDDFITRNPKLEDD